MSLIFQSSTSGIISLDSASIDYNLIFQQGKSFAINFEKTQMTSRLLEAHLIT